MTHDEQANWDPRPTARNSVVPHGSPPSQWRWWYDTATGDRPELFLYTNEVSIEVGEHLELRVHTTLPTFDLEIWRDGAERDVVHEARAVGGRRQPTRPDAYRNGCGWEVTTSVDTHGWPPGGYVVRATALVDGMELNHTHWIAVRPVELQPHRLTLVRVHDDVAGVQRLGRIQPLRGHRR
ncbi:MAG: hypothetical protein R2705_04985 [Ilumatobacteraceae bacterium]